LVFQLAQLKKRPPGRALYPGLPQLLLNDRRGNPGAALKWGLPHFEPCKFVGAAPMQMAPSGGHYSTIAETTPAPL